MEQVTYDKLIREASASPCNGCGYEGHCKAGFSCPQYRKWQAYGTSQRRSRKSFGEYPRIPDLEAIP